MISKRQQQIKFSATDGVNKRVGALVAAGKNIINLGVGEPYFGTPDHVIEAAKTAMSSGQTRYTTVSGIHSLRAAIADKFQRDNQLNATAENVMTSAGAKQSIFNVLAVSLEEGDEVIIPAPYWVSYPDMVLLARGVPKVVSSNWPSGKALSGDDLETAITMRTKWLILNSPNNPTGKIYTADELLELADVLRRHPQVMVISDDIYEYIRFDGNTFATLAQVAPDLADRVVTINGVSKAYGMTGWRIGYATGPAELIDAMGVYQSQAASCPCSVSQVAAEAAISGPQEFRAAQLEYYEELRDIIVEAVADMPGVSAPCPDGSFYIYVDVSGLMGGTHQPSGRQAKSDLELADLLIEEAGVAATPGEAFGASPALRLCFAVQRDDLVEAIVRMKDCFGAIRQSG
ncbi:pyridoxal phosphate-dependent aminotransferase [Shimia sediminis]|uniref:pyridoxal phosphate-dependent aminotransferase n=1 Tax=Shimia sediminis TaxID=2497945 RepID=UPI000F8EB955|nr:pyridoxal phosphate-dependent aminotransferase [Shimia sediminis]